MPTLLEYVKTVWTGKILPAGVATGLENLETGVKDVSDILDTETDAGRSMTQAADAAAQRALLNVEDGADVTDEANVTAVANATAEVTAAPAHWWVLVGGALKRMTQAGWTALVLVATGKTNGATGYTLAGGTTPKTLTVSADADTATIPNAAGKSAAENIGGKTGASEAIKLGVAAAEAMETGAATATPADTDILPGVKSDHSLLKYTWANIKAAIWTALGALIAAGTDKATPLDADTIPLSSAADSAATRKLTWANLKSVLATAFKHGGSNEIATATPGANAIPKADGSGKLDEWVTGSANIPTAAQKSTLADISAATGATTALKLANLTSAASSSQQGVALLGASGGAAKLTKLPDGALVAQVLYSKAGGSWTTVDGWDGTGTESIENGNLKIVVPTSWSTATTKAIAYDGSFPAVLLMRVRTTSLNPILFTAVSGGETLFSVTPPAVGVDFRIAIPWVAVPTDNVRFRQTVTGGVTFYLKDIYFGAYTYAPGSLTEEADRIANLRADMPGVGAYATQTITATDLATATKGDTIGGKKYTFVTALTPSPGVEGEVLKGATKEEELENENLAISEVSRANNGVKYWAAAVHPLVSSSRSGNVLTLTAKTKDGPENLISIVCESGTNHTAGGATLAGGYSDSAAKTIEEIKNNIAGNKTRPAAAMIERTNTSLIGYEVTVKLALGATYTFPTGGTFDWVAMAYDANIGGADQGTVAGGSTVTMAGANSKLWIRRRS